MRRSSRVRRKPEKYESEMLVDLTKEEVSRKKKPRASKSGASRKKKKSQPRKETIDLTQDDDLAFTSTLPKVVPFARGFKVPSRDEVKKALGIFKTDPGKILQEWEEKRHFVETNDQVNTSRRKHHFSNVQKCNCIDDWLAQYNEEGQTFNQYLRFVTTRSGKFKVSANANRKTICLQPIGFDDEKGTPKNFLARLREYTEAFFGGTNVLLLPPVRLQTDPGTVNKRVYWVESDSKRRFLLRSRHDSGTKRRQIQVDSILTLLSSKRSSRAFQKLYPDAHCLVGITLEDLFDTKPDLFVAGMAAGGSKVGVFQFYRYNPAYRFSGEFWFKRYPVGTKRNKKADSDLLLARSCKLLVHEICHIYGIDHCKFYDCVMNGSGHLEEDFRQPYHLCPIDLRKLAHRLGFDVRKRYEMIGNVCKGNPALREYGDWIASRSAALYSANIVE